MAKFRSYERTNKKKINEEVFIYIKKEDIRDKTQMKRKLSSFNSGPFVAFPDSEIPAVFPDLGLVCNVNLENRILRIDHSLGSTITYTENLGKMNADL